MPDEFQNFLLDITSLTQFVNFKSFRFWNKNKISEYASRIATKKSFQQQNHRHLSNIDSALLWYLVTTFVKKSAPKFSVWPQLFKKKKKLEIIYLWKFAF